MHKCSIISHRGPYPSLSPILHLIPHLLSLLPPPPLHGYPSIPFSSSILYSLCSSSPHPMLPSLLPPSASPLSFSSSSPPHLSLHVTSFSLSSLLFSPGHHPHPSPYHLLQPLLPTSSGGLDPWMTPHHPGCSVSWDTSRSKSCLIQDLYLAPWGLAAERRLTHSQPDVYTASLPAGTVHITQLLLYFCPRWKN